MKPMTSEWVKKAEGDFVTGKREMLTEPPNYDAVAFHAQQCAEKYLKARLIEAGISFPKTNDLSAILTLVLPLEPSWENLRPQLDALTSLGIEVRYPGVLADSEDAQQAIQTAHRIRNLVRQALGLDR